MPIEWLVAAGCVRTVVSGLVSLEGFGLAPRFRAAVQAGEVEIEEYSEHTLICRLQAAAYRIPYMPTKAGLGTDMLAPPPRYDPRADRPARPASPTSPARRSRSTSAIVHAEAADTRGNVRVDPKLVWMDSELVKAPATDDRDGRADRPRGELPRRARTARPTRASRSTTVVEAPWGAYPTSCFPRYRYDGDFFRAYAAAHADPAAGGGVLGRADRRPRDATPRSWTRTAAPRTLLSIARRTT